MTDMGDSQGAWEKKEWLVADRRGAFAMGTWTGARARKYHGFYLGASGRSEFAFLSDLEIECAGRLLWPHCFADADSADRAQAVLVPDPARIQVEFSDEPHPTWKWALPEGTLEFHVQASPLGGIRLQWRWMSAPGSDSDPVCLRVRPFFAMRELHGIGGNEWVWHREKGDLVRVVAKETDGHLPHSIPRTVFFQLEGGLQLKDEPVWYDRFLYPVERDRGYDSMESVYSYGVLEASLYSEQGCGILISEASQVFLSRTKRGTASERVPILDFMVQEPAGVIAGFPWFGEWGRDTFISLPGLAGGWLGSAGKPVQVINWANDILTRWGHWIRSHGMLPNLIGKDAHPQWESSDATLWWTHALASLWIYSLAGKRSFDCLKDQHLETLGFVLQSIREGRHKFLKVNSQGLLEVTDPHTTWMDARVDGRSVTPRTGVLPEINALWFQARCLHKWWSEGTSRADSADSIDELLRLGRLALECREPDRPNGVFLHSLPLAPSFVLSCGSLNVLGNAVGSQADGAASQLAELAELGVRALNSEMAWVTEKLWTPVGLRTLSPDHPDYQRRYSGDQRQRDLAYHQGPAWGWLGGHYEMARRRLDPSLRAVERSLSFREDVLEGMPIRGHIAEIFDPEPPFAPGGAPAQAWSLACWHEASFREQLGLDEIVRKKLAKLLSSGASDKGRGYQRRGQNDHQRTPA